MMLILLPNLMVLGKMGRGACGSGSELDAMGPEGCMSSGTKSLSPHPLAPLPCDVGSPNLHWRSLLKATH